MKSIAKREPRLGMPAFYSYAMIIIIINRVKRLREVQIMHTEFFDVEETVRQILEKLPSESAILDYKMEPYSKDHKADFVKDVIAMLNSPEARDKDKLIIFGVITSDTKPPYLKGISMMPDDNEWQNLVDKITPRPNVDTGQVTFQSKLFGYIHISAENSKLLAESIFEVKESIFPPSSSKGSEKHTVLQGQAFYRRGSHNYPVMDTDRQKLRAKILFPANTIVAVMAALCGEWDESFDGDKKFIESITDMPYSSFINEIRNISKEQDSALVFKNNIWKLKFPKADLLALSSQIFDDHLTGWSTCALKVLETASPRYDMPADKRFTYMADKKDTQIYSPNLRIGISQTLAILGNNAAKFTNLSTYTISNILYSIFKNIFENPTWQILATLAPSFTYLAQASPQNFLNHMLNMTSNPSSKLLEYVQAQDQSICAMQYGSELSFALAQLALFKEYFHDSISIMLSLASKNNMFLDAACRIILPWLQQTHAPLALQITSLKEISQTNLNMVWKLLLNIIPDTVRSTVEITLPEYVKCDKPEKITGEKFLAIKKSYIDFACSLQGKINSYSIDILNLLTQIPVIFQHQIIESASRDICSLSEAQKLQLWNEIMDIIHRNMEFSDADWTLAPDRIQELKDLASAVLPNSAEAYSLRLFRKDQYSLLYQKEYKSYDQQREELALKQKAILRQHLKEGLPAYLKFVDKAANKSLIGFYSAALLPLEDIKQLISNSTNLSTNEFLIALIQAIPFDHIAEIISPLSETLRTEFLIHHRTSELTLNFVSQLSYACQLKYWNQVSGFNLLSLAELKDVQLAISNLNKQNRFSTSIFILHNWICLLKHDIPTSYVTETLLNLTNLTSENGNISYEITQLIEWLQKEDSVVDSLGQIEFKYLELLDPDYATPPEHLYNMLASEPQFFFDVIKSLSGKNFSIPDDVKGKVSEKCWKLLLKWDRIPGTESNGIINTSKLEEWDKEFKHITQSEPEETIKKITEQYYGKVLFHAPADPDGLFIHQAVAKILESDNDGEMLKGYHLEALNSRGVYIGTFGKEESSIADNYYKKADIAENAGYFKFAKTLRDIADSYKMQGEEAQKEIW